MKKQHIFLSFLLVSFSCAKAQSSGDVIITEFMPDPAKVADGSGEWLELYNTTSQAININGWHIRDGASKNHSIHNKAPLLIPAKGFLLLSVKADSSANGGIHPDYAYSNFSLSNTSGKLLLTDSTNLIIDSIRYSNVVPGKAWNLDPLYFNGKENDFPDHWCSATQVYGLGDYGTPRLQNASCLTNEISDSNKALLDEELKVYPNPTKNGCLLINHTSSAIQQVELYNLLGKLLYTWSNLAHLSLILSLPNLDSGIYFLNVRTFQKGRYHRKIIVE
jgi:hypothetical protein